ncbi:MAG: hypothetical protein V7607_6236 [Solirubrobacteraceae bacterium]
MSTDDVLLGLGLVTVLAVGSQLLAGRVRLPAIVVPLPTRTGDTVIVLADEQ